MAWNLVKHWNYFTFYVSSHIPSRKGGSRRLTSSRVSQSIVKTKNFHPQVLHISLYCSLNF